MNAWRSPQSLQRNAALVLGLVCGGASCRGRHLQLCPNLLRDRDASRMRSHEAASVPPFGLIGSLHSCCQPLMEWHHFLKAAGVIFASHLLGADGVGGRVELLELPPRPKAYEVVMTCCWVAITAQA
ncbi:hypothetical protein E2C01_065307 [Portunus trituberculatus]|uniref:Uncharacterized protein n=1 Tax=Portunus trituberculatus TaxID=210409 RepID=A0A5B7HE55_PORTR|nr:hypothetical protein [Portunus trituberculatus]